MSDSSPLQWPTREMGNAFNAAVLAVELYETAPVGSDEEAELAANLDAADQHLLSLLHAWKDGEVAKAVGEAEVTRAEHAPDLHLRLAISEPLVRTARDPMVPIDALLADARKKFRAYLLPEGQSQ